MAEHPPKVASSTNETATSTNNNTGSGGGHRASNLLPTVLGQDGIKILPQRFETCQVEDLVALIAHMLERLIQHNDGIALTPNSLTRFHSRAPPGISVHDYLSRITKFTNVEPCCLLILLHYIDKISEKLPTFTITSLTVHRFVIAAVAAGSKALCDSFCTNGRYAKVGGVSLVEMNVLEKELLHVLEWRLTTSGALLARYYESLVVSHPSYRLSPSPPPFFRTTTDPDTADADAIPDADTAQAQMEVDSKVSPPNAESSPSPYTAITGNGRQDLSPKRTRTAKTLVQSQDMLNSPLAPTKTAPPSPLKPFAVMAD